MKDSEDPFMAFMDFLDGKSDGARRVSHLLDESVQTVYSNLVFTSYLAVSGLILLLLVSPILLYSSSQPLTDLGGFMNSAAGLTFMCHQLPYRSFVWGGIPFPVCARDVGIYMGAIAGFATLMLPARPKRLGSVWLLAAALLPILLDGVSQTILGLRESNNIIRVVTGLVFGFGAAAFLANRFFLRWTPGFRERVVHRRLYVLDAAAAALAVMLVASALSGGLGVHYLGREGAIEKALAGSSVESPAYVGAYYVSSLAPVSAYGDSFYGNHRDLILDDLKDSDFVKERLLSRFGGGPRLGENASAEELIMEAASREHSFGIWAVAVLEEEPEKGEAPYISRGRGEYLYYDAVTGELIMRRNH